MAVAFETGKYRNVFAEYGYPEAEIQRRVEQTFEIHINEGVMRR